MTNDILFWLLRQSVLALIVGGLAHWLERRVHSRPRLFFWVWNLVLLRFVWPDGWSLWRLTELGLSSGQGSTESGSSTIAAPRVVLDVPAIDVGWSLWPAFALWAGGVVLVAGHYLRARNGFGRIFAQAVPATPAETESLVQGLEVPLRVTFHLSNEATAPFVLGLFRHRIVLPRALMGAQATRRRAVVAHELAHVERRDEFWLGFEMMICCLFFFHPVAWHAARRASLAREVLCDARALAHAGTAPATYARALLASSRVDRARVVAAFSPSYRTLEHRIHAVLRRGGRSRWQLGTSALSVGVVLLTLGGIPISAAARPAALTVDPLPGARVSSSFGLRQDPIAASRRHHDGIDLVSPHGTPVLAAGDGLVRRASQRPSGNSGLRVLVDHGAGLTTFYAHLSAVDVEIGQRVLAGERIGAVGRTGRVTGTHLHFEIREASTPSDPAQTFPVWTTEAVR